MKSSSKPLLVSDKTIKQLEKTFRVARVEQTGWTESMGNFYEEYIQPNMFAIIVFFLLFLFLTIRYVLKSEENKKKATIRKLKKKIKYNDIDNYDNFNEYITRKKYNQTRDNLDINLPIYNDQSSVFDGSIYPEYMLKDELVNNGNANIFYNLQQEYDYNIKNSNGEMSKQMIDDIYKTKTSKYVFDEMSRLVSGQ